ncbi:MAG: LysM peptidoglycan-binding domain-containing protein [Candidatus Cybelea sp.]
MGIRLDAMGKRKRFTLMPAIALAALGLMIALPSLSSVRLYAATAPTYVTVTVRPGDTIWSIATSHDRSNLDLQELVDRISDANRLQGGALQPGQRLRIPE